MAVTLRGTSKATGTSSSFSVPFPTGSAIGDLLVITFASSFSTGSPPVGWTRIDNSTGSFLNGAVYYKIAADTDITAGSVTVNAGGANQATVVCYAFTGHDDAGPTLKFVSRQGASSISAGSVAPASALSVQAGSMCVYSGHLRFASGASVPTVSRGTLRESATVSGIGSEAGYTEAFAGATSGVSPTLSYAACQGIYYVVLEVAAPVVGNPGTLTATLPPLSANLTGTSAPPPVTGTIAATLPALSANLAGTSTPPAVTGTLAASLPPLTAVIDGQSAAPGAVSGSLSATLPPLSAAISGTVTAPPAPAPTRAGFGLVLASSSTTEVVPPPGAVTRLVPLHVVTPTVPAPTLADGRPA